MTITCKRLYMNLDEIKDKLIEVLYLCNINQRENREWYVPGEIFLTENILRENSLATDTFWTMVCPFFKSEGLILSYSDKDPARGVLLNDILKMNRLSELKSVRNDYNYQRIDVEILEIETYLKEQMEKSKKASEYKFVVNLDKLSECYSNIKKTPKEDLNNRKRLTKTGSPNYYITFDEKETCLFDGKPIEKLNKGTQPYNAIKKLYDSTSGNGRVSKLLLMSELKVKNKGRFFDKYLSQNNGFLSKLKESEIKYPNNLIDKDTDDDYVWFNNLKK